MCKICGAEVAPRRFCFGKFFWMDVLRRVAKPPSFCRPRVESRTLDVAIFAIADPLPHHSKFLHFHLNKSPRPKHGAS